LPERPTLHQQHKTGTLAKMEKSLRLSQAVEQYLDYWLARYSTVTVTNEGHVLRRFVANIGDREVTKVTAEMVEDWFGSLLRPHTDRAGVDRPAVSASSANYYRTRIAALHRWAVARGLTRSDWLAHSPRMREQKRVRQQPSPDVLFRMLNSAAEPSDRIVLSLAMNTGLRASEIASLRVGDVDLDTLTLRVTITKSRLEDDMPITSDLAAELSAWLRHYAMEIERPLIAEDYLCPAHSGPRIRWVKGEDGEWIRSMTDNILNPSRPVSKLHRIVQHAMWSVGLETRHEGVHTVRRAVARAYYDSLKADGHEVAVRAVMVLLHHSNQSTTEAYLGVTCERAARDLSLRGRSFLQPSRKATVTPIRTADN